MQAHSLVQRASLASRLTLSCFAIAAVAAIGVAAVSWRAHEHDLHERLALEAGSVAESLAHHVGAPPETLPVNALEELGADALGHPDVAYLRVLDAKGAIVFERRRDARVEPPPIPHPAKTSSASSRFRHGRTGDGGAIVDAVTPIRLFDHPRGDDLLARSEAGGRLPVVPGYLQLGLRARPEVLQARRLDHATLLLAWGAGILVACGLLAHLAARRLTRPVRSLVEATRQIAGGDFEARIPTDWSDSDSDELSVAMKTMLSRVNEYREEIAAHRSDLEERVEERTRLLQQRTDEAVELAHRAQESSRTKSRFVANMSHEIRTPMNGVLGMADTLFGTPLDERQQRYLRTLHDSATGLLAIIDDVLDFSKIEEGHLEVASIPFELPDLIDDVTRAFAQSASHKQTRLVWWIAEDVPDQLLGDPIRIGQVLRNFVGNALKFTEGGEVVIRATVAAGETEMLPEGAPAAVIELSVSDTGTGIPRERHATIFDPFTQADDSLTRRFGGTGLGLTICRQLTELMGGEIGFDSESDRGSRFWVRLPLPVVGSPQSEAATQSPWASRNPHVLLSGPEGTGTSVLDDYLKRLGAETVRADEPEAIEGGLREGSTELIVCLVESEAVAARLDECLAALDDAPRVILASAAGLALPDRLASRVGTVLECPVSQRELAAAVAGEGEGPEGAGSSGRETGRRRTDPLPQFAAEVLVVEDNATNQIVAREFLDRLGCTSVLASNGDEAVRAASERRFDLIFMDCQMPVMDGLAATRAIRALEEREARPRIPIVALTAHALAVSQSECFEAGMDGYVRKPFTVRDLARSLLDQGIESVGPGSTVAAVDRPTPATGSGAEVLDRFTLDEIAAMQGPEEGDSLIRELVDRFTAETSKLLETLEAAAGDDAWESVGRTAHAIKSSSAQLGLRRLSDAAAELEHDASRGSVDHAEARLDSLRRELDEALAALEAFLSKETGSPAANELERWD